MKVFLRGAGLVLVVGLSGCAAMSEEQCRRGDWEAVGERDGVEGRAADSRLSAYRDACGEVGIKPDEQAYRAAWSKGVARYCLPQNAYAVGRDGSSYSGVCPVESERLFQINHAAGRRVYELEQQIAALNREIEALEDQLMGQRNCGESTGKKLDKSVSRPEDYCVPSPPEQRRLTRRVEGLYDERKVLRRLLGIAELVPIMTR